MISFAAVLGKPEAAIAQLCNAIWLVQWLVWTGLNCIPKQNISNFWQSKCFHSTSTIINGTICGIMPNAVCSSKRTLSWSELQHSQVCNWNHAPTQTHSLLLYANGCKWMLKQAIHFGNMLLWSGSQVLLIYFEAAHLKFNPSSSCLCILPSSQSHARQLTVIFVSCLQSLKLFFSAICFARLFFLTETWISRIVLYM